MSARIRFALAVAVLGLLMTGPFVLTGVVLFADAQEAERLALVDLLAPRLPLGALITTFGFVVGVVLFSGSLYAMTFLGDEWRKLGMITPLGGLAFIVGWIAVAVAAWKS